MPAALWAVVAVGMDPAVKRTAGSMEEVATAGVLAAAGIAALVVAGFLDRVRAAGQRRAFSQRLSAIWTLVAGNHGQRVRVAAAGSGADVEATTASPPADQRTTGAAQFDQVREGTTRPAPDLRLLPGGSRVVSGPGWVDVDDLLEESLQRAGFLAPRRWEVGESPGGWVFAHRCSLIHAMECLMANAVSLTGENDAISLGGTWANPPAPDAGSTGPGPGSVTIDGLNLWVSASGAGIAPTHGHIPSPPSARLPRSRPEGAGRWLPVAKGIVEAHGGTLWLRPAVYGGRTPVLWFPARPAGVGPVFPDIARLQALLATPPGCSTDRRQRGPAKD